MSEGERIAKVMARAGLCSRRDAERWIEEGRVKINGTRIESPACNVSPHDAVEVDGKPLPKMERPRVWLFHKPAGVVTTHKDPEGRPRLFDLLPKEMPRVISIGRLDLNTEGLILLTNHGEVSRYAELPQTAWKRTYRVRVYGVVVPETLAPLKKGLRIKEPKTEQWITYKEIDARIDKKSDGRNSWLVFTLTEGKNREIRNICRSLGLQVNRLIRTSYGPFELGNLERGECMEIPYASVKKHFKAVL